MGASPVLTEASASLHEVDSALAWRLTRGRERILPVLFVPAGRWAPPRRDALGTGTLALVALDGLLAAGSPAVLHGPGDVLEPWATETAWTACTEAHLAVLGSRYMGAVQAWPGAAARLLGRSGAGVATRSGGELEERVLSLLWRIAARWGTPEGQALALPRAVDTRVVATVLECSEPRVASVVAGLANRGRLERNGRWRLLAPSGDSGRRDELRARSALQIALARAIQADYVSLTAQIRAQLARRG